MKCYAIIYWMNEDDDAVELWTKIYQTEHDAKIALEALKHYDIYDGTVVPVELVTI